MSRIRQLTASIGSTLVSQVVMATASVIFMAYFGRKLPKSEMALYALASTLVSWIELVAGLGLSTLTIREVPGLIAKGDRSLASRLISTTIVLSTLVAALTSVVLFVLAPSMSTWLAGSGEYVREFRVLAVVAFCQYESSLLSLMQWALQRFHIKALCDSISGIGTQIMAVGGYLTLGITGFLLAFGVGSLMVACLQGWSMRRELTLQLLPIRTLLARSGTYLGIDVLRNLMMNLDRPVVGVLLGNAALADYFVAKRCYDYINSAMLAVAAPLGAKISEVKVQDPRALEGYFNNCLRIMAILFIPAGFALIGMGDTMLRLLVGAKYASGGGVIACFGVTAMAQCTYLIWREGLWRLLHAGWLMMHNIVLACCTFGLYFLLLPAISSPGLPLSSAFAYIAASLLSAVLLRRKVGIRVQWGLYCRAVGCGTLTLAAILIGGAMARQWHFGLVATAAIMAVFAVVAYAPALWFSGPPQIRSWGRTLRARWVASAGCGDAASERQGSRHGG